MAVIRWTCYIALVFIGAYFSASTTTYAIVRPVHAPIQVGQVANVLTFSDDSQFMVYSVTTRKDNAPQDSVDITWFVVPVSGGEPRAIATLPSVDSRLPRAQMCHTGQYVILSIELSGLSNVDALYSMPLDGGPLVQITPPFGSALDTITTWRVSADCTHVVYRAVFAGLSSGIYSFGVTGGTPVRLSQAAGVPTQGARSNTMNATDTEQVNTSEFTITPDSLSVLYQQRVQADSLANLYRVPIGGGVSEQLNAPLAAGIMVQSYALTSDGTAVVYHTAQPSNIYGTAYTNSQLFVCVLNDRTVTPLGTGAPLPRPVVSFTITRDSQYVVYQIGSLYTDVDLYSVPIHGGVAIQLTPSRGKDQYVRRILISNDSRHVVYEVATGNLDPGGLYSVGIDGSNTIQLTTLTPPDSFIGSVVLSADSQRVVFTTVQKYENTEALLSVAITGGKVLPLYHSQPPGSSAYAEQLEQLQLTPDDQSILWWQPSLGIYRVPRGGGVVVRVDDPAVSGSFYPPLDVSPDGTAVFYRGRLEATSISNLYRADLILPVYTNYLPLVSQVHEHTVRR